MVPITKSTYAMSRAAHKQFAVQLAMITWLKKGSHKTHSVA